MTKRFTLFDDGETIIDNESVADDGGKEIYWTVEYVQRVKLVELLNELHEENTMLKERRHEDINELSVIAMKYKALEKENEQLKKELSEYKDFVFSDDKILCYTCLFCTHKGIYEVDCDVKGHVDVHGTCHSYAQKELEE